MPDTDAWLLSDSSDFKCGKDAQQTRSGNDTVFLKSVVPRPKAFGSMQKEIEATHYAGKRIKMSALVKTELPDGAAVQLWLRVDGEWKQRQSECFDNMFNRRIKGLTDWQRHEVSVEVPADSKKIVYGVLLDGTGCVWLDGILIEECQS